MIPWFVVGEYQRYVRQRWVTNVVGEARSS